MALTDAKIKAAKPGLKPYKLGDSGQLYLWVTPAGGRLWRMNYTFGKNAAGKAAQKTLSFGGYPAVVLSEARRKRDEAKALLVQGIDPGAARKSNVASRQAAEAHTFEHIARRWHALNADRWSKVHSDDVIWTLERDVFPVMGTRAVRSITAPDVLQLLVSIENRGAIETAKRVRQRMSAVFVYAIAAGLAESDPAAVVRNALRPIVNRGRQPAITDLEGVRQVLKDAEAQRCRAVTKLALRLLALTAVRPGELRGARWAEMEELDGELPVWRIPAERMKGDQARKAAWKGDHLVPLAPEAVAVLQALKSLTGTGELAFPNERHIKKPMSENALGYLLNRAGYHHRHVPHGWRASFSTIMNERAIEEGRPGDRAVIDLMLAHIPQGLSGSEAAYNRAAFLPRRREIANEWAKILLAGFPPPSQLLGQPMRWGAVKDVGQ